MKNLFRKLTGILLCLSLLCGAALADSLSLDGTVTADDTAIVCAPIGGTVAEVRAETGDRVEAGDVLAQLKTTPVYAAEDGTVRGVFVSAGDSAEETAAKYGALLYIEGAERFTVSASTNYAYSSEETKYIHTGEKVYLQCRKDSSRTGVGVVTAVSGTGYTVLVEGGNLMAGDSADIFRDEAFSNTLRIGRGTAVRRDPAAVTASGSVVSVAVKDGDSVRKGDLLLETLEGTYDGYRCTGSAITAGTAGIVTQLSVTEGAAVAKDAVVAAIVPEGALRVEAEVAEEDLRGVTPGAAVRIELTADEDEDISCEGTVRGISAVATEGAEGVTYTVIIDFPADSHVRLGMTATVVIGDEAAEPAEAPAEGAGG